MVRSSLRAPIVDGKDEYVGRPGLSPVIAALVAAGEMRRGHHILDVGCGRGSDLLALAALGFRNLHGIDHNRRSIANAKRRKGAPKVDFRLAPLTSLLDEPAESFDWVIDTFLVNNLEEGEESTYLAWLARLLARGGRLVVQSKCRASDPEAQGEGGLDSPYIDLGPPVMTWFAEYRDVKKNGRWRRVKTAVPGFVQIGARNGRRIPAAALRA